MKAHIQKGHGVNVTKATIASIFIFIFHSSTSENQFDPLKMDATRCLDDIDRDFKYKHANDSHSWITDYPTSLRPDPNSLKISFKNEVFSEPEVRRETTKGKRKKLLEAFYRQVISEEVFGQFDAEEVVRGDYETQYREKFKNPDDMPLPGEKLSKNERFKKESKSCPNELSKQSKLEEMKNKYPLYLSTPLTFFSQTTGRSNFRKNSTITKSPDQNYDNIEY